MNRIKLTRMLALLLAAAMLCLCVGCGQPKADPAPTDAPETTDKPDTQAPAETDKPAEPTGVTVTDMLGRKITLDAPAERVVALTASCCEILYAIGCGDTLVGRGTYCNYPAEVLEIAEVASGAETNVEQIIALAPDVILMSDMAQSEEQIAQLEAAGVHVVVTDASNIAETYDSIRLIGQLMGKADKADELIGGMESTFNALREKVQSENGDAKYSVYFEVSPLEWGLWAAGTNTFMDEVAQLLGLENIFADVDGWGSVSEEQVLSRNPDYIVTISMYFGEGPTPTEEILGRVGWENVPAVQNSAILNLQNDELSRPGPRLAEGAQLLYDFVYGA